MRAFREVADVLRELDHNEQALTATTSAYISAQEMLNLVQKRYAMCATSYLEVLITQQMLESSRMALNAARAQRLTDAVAFFFAMGRGWKDDNETGKE